MERPFLQKPFLSPIITAVKEFRLFSLRLNFLQSKTFLIVLSFLCLGGFVLLIDRLFQPRPTKTWDIKSIQTPSVDTKPSLTTPSAQKLMEEISKSNTHHPSGKPELVSPESPKPVSPPPSPLALMKEEDKLMEIVTIKKGYTISSLTEKYYGMVNNTLMDLILDSNSEIKDVHLILVDQKIKVPKITKELLIMQSTDHAYKIQVGTFQNPDFVRFYSNEPVLKGKVVEIFPRKVSPQETWYRVVVGPFGHKDECLKVIAQLKEKGLLPVFGGIFKME
jgi:hypothetical protein